MSAVRHTLQKQVLQVQSQSFPRSILHPHHPHTNHITPHHARITPSHSQCQTIATLFQNESQQSHNIAHLEVRERGQMCATPGRRKCLKSSVSHSLLQPCIHTIHTQLTSDHDEAFSAEAEQEYKPITFSLIFSSATSITSRRFRYALTMSIHRNTTNTHITNHTISLTLQSERGQLCATPSRRKCFKSRVSHCILQIYIHTNHTQFTSHPNHSIPLPMSNHRNTFPKRKPTIPQYRSPRSERERSDVRHTRQTQVLEVQRQSLPSSTLHQHHPHTTNITPQSLFTHSLIHNSNPSQHHYQHKHNNNHITPLTLKSEKGKMCATPRRRKCFKSRVSHSFSQICIHTIHTILTSHHNHSFTHNINPSQHFTNTNIYNPSILLTFESKRSQMCATPGGRKCLNSRVTHFPRQSCILTIKTQLTSDSNHFFSQTCQSIATLPQQ